MLILRLEAFVDAPAFGAVVLVRLQVRYFHCCRPHSRPKTGNHSNQTMSPEPLHLLLLMNHFRIHSLGSLDRRLLPFPLPTPRKVVAMGDSKCLCCYCLQTFPNSSNQNHLNLFHPVKLMLKMQCSHPPLGSLKRVYVWVTYSAAREEKKTIEKSAKILRKHFHDFAVKNVAIPTIPTLDILSAIVQLRSQKIARYRSPTSRGGQRISRFSCNVRWEGHGCGSNRFYHQK